MRRYFFILFALFTVWSCSTNKTIFISNDYKDKKIKNKTLAIILIPPEPVIDNNFDIIQQIEDGDPNEVYKNYLKKNLKKYIKRYSFFKSVFFTQIDSTVQFKKKKLSLNKKRKLNFLLPNKSEILKTDSIQADFVLMIQNLFVSREYKNYLQFLYPLNIIPLNYSRPIQFGKFLFWDNHKGKIISFGKFNRVYLNKEAVEKIAKQILLFSPFKSNYRIRNMPR